MEANRASSVSACWTCEIEKCVSRTEELSGPRSSAANGRFSCKVLAVVCRVRHVLRAVSICSLVKDVCTEGEVTEVGSVEGTDTVAEGGAAEVVEDVGVKGGLLTLFVAVEV